MPDFPPAMPSMAAPPMGPQAPQGPAGLLSGPGPSAPPAVEGVPPEAQQQAIMGQIRDLHMQLDAIARQNPACAQEIEIAKQALANAMTKIVVASSSTEPTSAPPLLS